MRRSLVFGLVLLLLLAIGSVQAAAVPTFVVIGKSVHPYWSEVELGVKAAAAKLGVKGVFFVPPKEDVPAQVAQMESYIAMGVNGISIAPSDPKALGPYIKKALEKGIPVITTDTDAPGSGRYCYIGTDNTTAGRLAGEAMAKAIGGKGLVAIGTGSLTAMNSLERMKGFREACARYPDIKVLEPVCDYEDTAKATALAEATITAHPDLAGIFGVYAFNGPAAARAVVGAGKKGKIQVVGFDTTVENITGVKDGTVHATVGQRPYMMGYLSIVVLNNMHTVGVSNTLLMFPKVGDDCIIDTGTDVVTKANLADYAKMLDEAGIPHSWKP